MVTVVTVTTINAKAVHIVSLAGAIAKGNRGRPVGASSFAYTQTIVRLYANDRSTILKSKRTPAQATTQFAITQAMVALTIILKLFHREFHPTFGTNIYKVLSILTFRWCGMNLIPHSTILSRHIL